MSPSVLGGITVNRLPLPCLGVATETLGVTEGTAHTYLKFKYIYIYLFKLS